MYSRPYLTFFSALLCTTSLYAAPLISPLDGVQWQYSGDQFMCKLTTDVNDFGSVSMIKKAGYPESVDLSSVIYTHPIKSYRLGSSQGPWSVKLLPKSHWLHSSQVFSQQISSQAPQLLKQLGQGMWGRINIEYVNGEQIYLVLPTVNRGQSFDSYYSCLQKLAPYSYQQVKDRNLYFTSGSYLLTQQQQDEMSRIARYISMDPKVGKILIDGHTDNIGTTASNLQLSQRRADEVYAFLLEAGVPARLIEVRSHGERYPLKMNLTAFNRSQNRRVNLRIIRRKGK